MPYEAKTHKIHTDKHKINLRTVKWSQRIVRTARLSVPMTTQL